MLYAVTIPIALTNGNDGRGSKWFRSSVRRKKIERDIRLLGIAPQPLAGRVDLTITRILGKGERLWDADSVGRGSAKELVDALVAVGWFDDDGPRHIRNCDYRQDDTLRHIGPAVRIEVRRAAEMPIPAPVKPVEASEPPETAREAPQGANINNLTQKPKQP